MKLGSIIKLMTVTTSTVWVAYFSIVIVIMLALLVAWQNKKKYIVKENNGYVAIYTEDSLGKEILKETTEIVTAYLPETDLVRLREGIKVIGKENLNAIIEDYE